MIGIAFDHDEATAVVVPGDALGGDAAEWAREAAARVAGHHSFGSADVDLLARALERAQRGAVGDAATNLLLFDPLTGSFTPVRMTLLDRGLSADEQRRYLAPPSLVKPRLRNHTSAGLGAGFSVTTLDQADAATVRWLHMPGGRAFFTVLGPVRTHAVMTSAVLLEEILDTVRLDGLAPAEAAAFDDGLLAEPVDEVWRS